VPFPHAGSLSPGRPESRGVEAERLVTVGGVSIGRYLHPAPRDENVGWVRAKPPKAMPSLTVLGTRSPGARESHLFD